MADINCTRQQRLEYALARLLRQMLELPLPETKRDEFLSEVLEILQGEHDQQLDAVRQTLFPQEF